MVKKTTGGRLTRHDWVHAGFAAVIDSGIEALAVEPLAARMGTTKGSFYWHFADRAELVTAVLDVWEQLATGAVVDELGQVADPRERLRMLLGVVFRDADEDRFEHAVHSAATHPQVVPALARVTASRVGFLTDLFLELGLPRARAHDRARIAYAAYLGHLQLRRLDPVGEPSPDAVRRYADELLAVLATP
ncbi:MULTISPECIES: TetR/AcrR family transcriptional regulator [Modestobacter]|uniref:HTH tetR-type domain-containing protein n=1 Tax=Modestobacter caceresii TaxID=1522368 RepID=A0A098Y7Q8_9ACTN|nr:MULTISPECIES: TetR/AcrR family transcriptional regulator [Modestobacter]KGH46888.1 hypothetical protein IN07_09715 [Modestobacter caceresii]